MTDHSFADIARAVSTRFGSNATIANVVVATLGASNRTVVFDLVEGASRRRLVSRQETYRGEEQMFLPPSQQFRIMQVVHASGFPVPEPIFEYTAGDAMGEGFVTAFVAGETMPKAIIHSEELAGLRSRLASRCGELLVQLHALDTQKFSGLDERPDSADPVAAFMERYDHYAEAHPAIELGFRWLQRHRPDASPKAFLHGDFRCGNLMVGPEDVRAVLDWECSHLGSPMEDIAWLCLRSWRFDRVDLPVGGFGQREDLYRAYRHAGGEVDPEAVRYWEVFGLVRWAIYNMMQAHGHVRGDRRSLAFAACGRNASLVEYDLLMTLQGHYT